ncbi:hypothetical protein HME9304_00961 [Flagellimonas maritima]|uniref:Multidrug resistance protein MdtA-like barrel-sandwich hybrid domain-containing protein n=1 Tax=Flagellimonas maritima TaxID=1383885 RepID=A0A2Z4LQB5_9FLAO|nr:HlyD family efflux transporter periplasmic adaptor subunit [Allomuricauda aurantiaca]AWX43962.1 hypothetical protein HME9304_00961 [Allomuricauda aurantiaca]
MRKILLSILGILLIVISIFAARQIINNKKRPKSRVERSVKTVFVDTVQNKTVPIVIESNGNLLAKRRVELYSEVQGVLKSSYKLFKTGQRFKRGQSLLRIDDSEYYSSVKAQKSNFYNLLASTIPDLNLDFPEIAPKWQDYLNQVSVDKALPSLPEMASDKENYFINGRGIISNYHTIKNLENRLSKYNIRAPFDGILTQALVNEGTLVRNGQKLGEFIDPSIYELEVAISKTYGYLLKEGGQVTLSNLEGTQKWTGDVVRINGRVNPETQTVSAFIEVKSEDLKEGMYLNASLMAKEESEAIEIPRKLMLDNNEVFVVKDSLLAVQKVNPVYFSEKKVVLKGLADGTVLLSEPVPGAYPGMLVRIAEIENATDSTSTETKKGSAP